MSAPEGPTRMRIAGVALALGALVLGALVLAGCGGATDAPAGSTTGDLLVATYTPRPGAASTRTTVACPATTDREARSCAVLGALDNPFTPPPADEACTQIYGGPQVLTVRGEWGGQAVDATFRRTNGCEITRYDAVAPAFVAGAGTGTTTTQP